MRSAQKTTPRETFKFSIKSKDLPATQGMLDLVRSELKSEMRSGFRDMESRFKAHDSRFSEMDARFKRIDARFNEVDARFNEVDARFNEVDARFKEVDARFDRVDSKLLQLDSKVEQVLTEVSRIGFLVEEQNSRNRVVLEGLTGLWQRQDRVEKRMDDVEVTVKSLARKRV